MYEKFRTVPGMLLRLGKWFANIIRPVMALGL